VGHVVKFAKGDNGRLWAGADHH
ncbi:unnamed protein product, partial [Allacma fusca]